MLLTIDDWYNLYRGDVLRDTQDARYLWRNPSETDEQHSERFLRASYPNWVAKAVDTYLGYCFYSTPKGDTNVVPWDIIALAKTACLHALIGGKCYILVLKDEGPKVYPATQVERDYDGKACRDIVKIACGDERLEIDLNAGTIVQIYEDGSKTDAEPFDDDQLIEVFWNETQSSLVKGIAHLALQVFNFSSILDYHISISMTWWLTGPGDVKREDLKPYGYIPIANGEQPLQVITVGTESLIQIIRQEIDKRVLQIGRMVGLEAEFAEELKFESGISKAYSLIDTNAIISNLAANISIACNKAAETYKRLNPSEPLASITLEPLLRPEADDQLLMKLKNFASFVNTPKAIKYAQIEATKVILSQLSKDQLAEVIADIEGSGGVLQDEFAKLIA